MKLSNSAARMHQQASNLAAWIDTVEFHTFSEEVVRNSSEHLTKWGVLYGRLVEAVTVDDDLHPGDQEDWTAALEAARELAGLVLTPCGLKCDGCGTVLATEADFARHFVVRESDRRQGNLNLGECPSTDKGAAIR